ncbi:unnamed protein product [Lathyrus oleraceus]|uniref:Uncharacterized protein n=1 Tax=Pisum sativum TaxID=3888 RepID=A0A9D5H037_PEA|nr:hypothetical protein KIW84_014819 [Pisum sativum]
MEGVGARLGRSSTRYGPATVFTGPWTPITQSQNANNNGSNGNVKDAPLESVEEPPRRKFKYIPVAVLEEQKNEATEIDEVAEKVEDESNPIEADSSAAEPTSKNEILDEKPDINDVPMEESEPQDKNQVVRQDLNESLDLSLGLTSHDEDQDSDSKTNQTTDGQ